MEDSDGDDLGELENIEVDADSDIPEDQIIDDVFKFSFISFLESSH